LNSAETVLVLQGGGSLGAYECGVYKALAKHNIKFDIIAGTSIGGVNASLIASNQNNTADEAAYIMEHFWLSLAEIIVPPIASSALPNKIRASLSSMYATVYGNPKAFMPRWFMPGTPDYFSPYNWTYLYDNTPLKNTLKRYVNFTKLKRRRGRNHNNNNNNNNYDNRTIRQNQKKDESDNIFTKNNNDNDSTIYSDTSHVLVIHSMA
jgi:NTE family protein